MLSGVSPTGRHVNLALTEEGKVLWGDFSGNTNGGSSTQTRQESVELYPIIQVVYITDPLKEEFISFQKAHIVEFFCRNNVGIRYAFSSNKAGPKNEPYIILPPGVSQPINLPANTFWSGSLFFAADTTATIQIEVWSEVVS